MQLMVTLHVQLTATYELKQQQKYLQSETVYAIANWKGKKNNVIIANYFCDK